MKKQIKAARILADLTQAQLCELTNIPLITLRRIEGNNDHKGLVSEKTILMICKTLEAEGIQFVEKNDTAVGSGVVLKDS